jgi:hypothetical protein
VILERVPLPKLPSASGRLAAEPILPGVHVAHVHRKRPALAEPRAAAGLVADVVAAALVHCVHVSRERAALSESRGALRALERTRLLVHRAHVDGQVRFGHERRAAPRAGAASCGGLAAAVATFWWRRRSGCGSALVFCGLGR